MWNRVLEWFSEARERVSLLRDFNRAAKQAFINGDAVTLLEARTTIGSSDFRHEFSRFMQGGFRIKALSGRPLSKNELIDIGKIVLDNEILVRKLVAFGWDTLEIHDNTGSNGCKWSLKKYIKIGGYIK